MRTFTLEEATPETVARELGPYPYGRWPRSESWAEHLRMYGELGLGEVRTSEDWTDLPRDEYVRVVGLVEAGQYVIRWASEAALGRGALGGATHQHFVFPSDSLDNARSGVVVLTADGRLSAG